MNRTAVDRFVHKFWLQNPSEDPRRQNTLPLTDITDYQYWAELNQETRIYTVGIYNNDGDDPVLIAEDDGNGLIVPSSTGILDTDTSANNSINYTDNELTLKWNATYLAGLTNAPFIHFKLWSLRDQEEHIETRDLLTEILQEYKEEELDKQRVYYDPYQIPEHLLDTFASDHNWTLDRAFSEEDSYIRRQLQYLFDFYKYRRRLPSIKYSVTVINKRVNLYNMLAERGATDQETADNYNDFTNFIRMNTDELLESAETNPTGVQAIYTYLYGDSNDFYPTKHFLLEMVMDGLNTDGSLLRAIDIQTLFYYVLQAKSKTQYPHFSALLAMDALIGYKNQDGSQFQYKLSTEEAQLSLASYETLYSGPAGVESIAMTGTGAWLTFPIIMNREHTMNSGIIFNMDISDLAAYIKTFELGSDSHDTITDDLTDLKASFYSSGNLEFLYDDDNVYLICTTPQNGANDTVIKEMGLFSKGGDLVFYAKYPQMIKSSTHTLVFKIKIYTP